MRTRTYHGAEAQGGCQTQAKGVSIFFYIVRTSWIHSTVNL